MLKLTSGMPQLLTPKIFMPSISLFFSLQSIIMLHLGHSKTKPVLLAAFRDGHRGSHKAALHLLSNIPVPFPTKHLSTSRQKEFSHKGQIPAGAYTVAWQGNEERQIHRRFVGVIASLWLWNSPKSWWMGCKEMWKLRKARHSPCKKDSEPLSLPS